MKVVQINATCGVGSTGKICVGISRALTAQGIENYILYSAKGTDYPLGIQNTTQGYINLQAIKSRVLGNYGFNSKHATKKLIRKLEQLQPTIVHLHNIHGHDCHFGMLLSYLKEKHIQLVWTFHDCWVFTALCPHFAMVQCNQWKTECHACPLYRERSFFLDRSRWLYRQKKQALQGLSLQIAAPSRWLADMVKQSFLQKTPTQVIYNGIDLEVFRPTSGNFRARNHLENKKIVLGVAFDWGRRKGLDVFADLAKTLPQEYQIILIGTEEQTERQLPASVLTIRRTADQKELAEIYTAADVFANPTREEVLGLVNLEALACGTPVVTFAAGGSPECLDESCGITVPCEDVAGMETAIRTICETHPFSPKACRKRAERFDEKERLQEYISLYRKLEEETV